jgi:hypothetical protein
MFKVKKTIWLMTIVILVAGIIYIALGVIDFVGFKKTVESAGGMPAMDGGKITMVRQPCILDTPATSPTTCAISCPLVTSALGPACVSYIEIDTMSQKGTIFIAAPISFIYRGGGARPTPGMQYIYGGASNVVPYVIGIPSSPGARIQKIYDWLGYALASFKEKMK